MQMCDALRGACTALDFILHMCICMYICMYEIVAGDGRVVLCLKKMYKSHSSKQCSHACL